MYTVNDVTGAVTAIKLLVYQLVPPSITLPLNDDKIFWTNGNDIPKYWDGTTVGNVTAAGVNSKFVIFHKNRAWFVDPNNPTKSNLFRPWRLHQLYFN
jgi:hypothetical protein